MKIFKIPPAEFKVLMYLKTLDLSQMYCIQFIADNTRLSFKTTNKAIQWLEYFNIINRSITRNKYTKNGTVYVINSEELWKI